MYKQDLALNNQQRLICHKPNQTKPLSVRPCNATIVLLSRV